MQGLMSRSELSLLAVNFGVIAFALGGDWSMPTILASYWLQSIIIGLFQAVKMAQLKTFSTDNLKINGHAVEPTPATRRKVVLFFLLHYGIFHAAYAGFILSAGTPAWPDVLLAGAAFFANHLYSYVANRHAPPRRMPNIGGMMFFPYFRIVPMQAFIVFGGLVAGSPFGLGFFLVLKTATDGIMHAIEHRGRGT
jgi:Family of unknown function (DUF6498)